MTLSVYLGIISGLGIVLVLMGGAFALLRRFMTGSASAGSRLRMEVVQRIALGPKQGIAVVRIGDNVVAVSMGEGGIRPLLEVDGEDREAILAAPAAATPQLPGLPGWVARRARVTAATPDASERLEPSDTRPGGPGATARPRRPFAAALRAALEPHLPMLLAIFVATAALATTAGAVAAQVEPFSPTIVDPAGAAQTGTGAVQPENGFAQIDTMITRIAPEMDLRIGQPDEGGLRLSGTVGVVVMMGLLTLLPTLLLMTTSFTRILVVLHFLRQALGTQTAPPAHLMAALALLLSGFVMAPTLSEVNSTALQPWMNGEIDQSQMLATGAQPFREFMLDQTREQDLATFLDLRGTDAVSSTADIPLVVLMSAFVTSELRTAFQIGFALFLPFIVVDVVVAAVLMSMGMFMLPPAMISLPFKLLLFVMVDGWSLVVQGLVQSFS